MTSVKSAKVSRWGRSVLLVRRNGRSVLPMIRRHRGEDGFSTGTSLLAMAIGLGLVAILLLINLIGFGGTTGHGGTSNNPSVLSHSTAENQIKLCVEGRASSYGNPPSPAQQSKCMNQLAGQISGDGSSLPGGP